MQWGLEPSQSMLKPGATIQDKLKFQGQTLNVMSEHFDPQKRLHPMIAKQELCLILTDGFYEYRYETKEGRKTVNKLPFFIHMPGEKAFAFAGVTRYWVNPSTGNVLETTAIFTTAANNLMSYIHNSKERMPAIVDKKNWVNGCLTI